MYKIIRPLLFLFYPETIHFLVELFLKVLYRIPLLSALISKYYSLNSVGLKKNICGIEFPNPVGVAAGFDKNATLYNSLSMFGFGFVEIGTVTPRAQKGNPKPRIFRLLADKAMINRMGFNNKGVDFVVKRLRTHKPKIIVGGNIGKNPDTSSEEAIKDYLYCFKELYNYVDYLSVNISCPNIGDISYLKEKYFLSSLLSELTDYRDNQNLRKPIFVKISPDIENSQLDEIIDVILEYKIDGIIATNTSKNREGLTTDETILKKIGEGGLSGKPIKKRSTEIIRYIRKRVNNKLVIIGCGGIFDEKDAIEKIEAGADLIQVYTGFIYEGPAIVRKILKKLVTV